MTGIFISRRDVFSFAFKDIKTDEIIMLKSIFNPIFFILQYTLTINKCGTIDRVDARNAVEWSGQLCQQIFGFDMEEGDDYDDFFNRHMDENGIIGTSLARFWLKIDLLLILADMFKIEPLENELDFLSEIIDKNESIRDIVLHSRCCRSLSHEVIRFMGDLKLSEGIYIIEEIKYAMKVTQSRMVDGSRLMRIEEKPIDDIIFQKLIHYGVLTLIDGKDGRWIGVTPIGPEFVLCKYEPCDSYIQRNIRWKREDDGGTGRIPFFETLNERIQFSHRMFIEHSTTHESIKAILDKLPDVQRLLFVCEEKRNTYYEFVEYTRSHTLIDMKTGDLCFYRDHCIWVPKQKQYHKGIPFEHFLPHQTCILSDIWRIANQINDNLDMVILLANQHGQPIPNRFVQWLDYLCGRKVKLCYCKKTLTN